MLQEKRKEQTYTDFTVLVVVIHKAHGILHIANFVWAFNLRVVLTSTTSCGLLEHPEFMSCRHKLS